MLFPRPVRIALLVLCACVLAKSAFDLGFVLLLQLQGGIERDSLLYFTVGRGILNGLTPWVDIFESKPPVMFLLAAGSLLVAGNEIPLLILQVLVLLALPLLTASVAWMASKNRPALERWTVTLVGTIAALHLTLYLEEHAGGIQTESFGTLTAALYGYLLLRWQTFSWKRIAALSTLLLLTIELKEPFLIVIVAIALLAADTPRRLLKTLIIPLAIAGVSTVVLLFLLGWWDAYREVYLPAMLSGRVNGSAFDPLWVRGFSIGRIFGNMGIYYVAPLLGYVVGATWIWSPVFRRRTEARLRDVASCAALFLLAYVTMSDTFLHLIVFNVWRSGAALKNTLPFFVPFPTYLLFIALIAGLLYEHWRRGFLWHSLTALAAAYLSAAAIGISVYATNHYAFAASVCFVLLFIALRYAGSGRASLWLTGAIAAVVLALGISYGPFPTHIADLRDRMSLASWRQTETTKRIDGLLDACNIERYGSLGTQFGFVKHSPTGPLFVLHFFEYLGGDHPLFVQTAERLATDATVIISGGGKDEENAKTLLDDRFTKIAPECAKPFLPINGYTLYFRKNP